MQIMCNKWNNGKNRPCPYPQPPLTPIIASLMISQYFVVLQYFLGVDFEKNSSISLIITLYWFSRKSTQSLTELQLPHTDKLWDPKFVLVEFIIKEFNKKLKFKS